jgi:hypothetical protein
MEKCVAAFFLLLNVLSLRTATAGPVLADAETDAQVYTARGETNGCGLSFTAICKDAEGSSFGATGNISSIQPDQFRIGTVLKIAGGYKRPDNDGFAFRVIDFAWFDVKKFGSTSKFRKLPAEQPNVFLSGTDAPKASLLPMMIAMDGATLGVHFRDDAVDEMAIIPPSKADVTMKVIECGTASAGRFSKLK